MASVDPETPGIHAGQRGHSACSNEPFRVHEQLVSFLKQKRQKVPGRQ